MNARAYGHAALALLGLGTADLVALNAWAMPSLLAVGEMPRAPSHDAVRVPKPAAAHGGGEGSGAPESAFNAATQPPAEPVNSGPRAAIDHHPEPSEDAAFGPAPNLQRDPALILFHKGTWWVGPASRRALRGSFDRVQQSSLVELEGHADATGPSTVNQRISENRAAAVEALLVSAGIEPERIRIRALGETHASGTALDRRVEIWIEP
jgi:outer membrane protein OmpA-like peptidoglycan-associated protein